MYVRISLPPYLRQISFEPAHPFIRTLINANLDHHAVMYDGFLFHNASLVPYVRSTYTTNDLIALEDTLTKQKTLDLPTMTQHSAVLREGSQNLHILPATAPGSTHGDMSNMVYLRDQIQTAEILLHIANHNPKRYTTEQQMGKQLLISALHLLSTPAQLGRFATCIDNYVNKKPCTQDDWPEISLAFDNLDGVQPNGWRNIQDTVQMLAYATLSALESGQLKPSDLLPSHKEMLGSVIPLLASAGSPVYENSGSWEEIIAKRTSVMAIETALTSKLFDLRLGSDGRNYAFFASEYQKYRRRYPAFFATDLDELLMTKTIQGLTSISAQLPFESPKYSKNSVKYRTADSTLVYILRYHIPELLVRYGIDVPAINEPLTGHDREEQIEDLILDQLQTLIDPQGYGMFRYRHDSYQRVNWGTDEVQEVIKNIKRFVAEDAVARNQPIDFDVKQSLRHQLTPAGRQASWSLGQAHIALWAADRFTHYTDFAQHGRSDRYLTICTKNLNAVLSLITGDDQFTSATDTDGSYHIVSVNAWRLPECYVTYQIDQQQTIVPSAHTPLYWSVALLKGTIGLLI